MRYFISYKYYALAIVLISYIGYNTTSVLWFPFSIQAGLTVTLFVYLGFFLKSIKYLREQFLFQCWAQWLGGLFCVIFCGKFYMVGNYYGNGFLDILGAFCGSYLVILLSKGIETNTKYISGVLNFYGKTHCL